MRQTHGAAAKPNKPVAIVSYDEKPGIQAIATTAPDRQLPPSTHSRSPETPPKCDDKHKGDVCIRGQGNGLGSNWLRVWEQCSKHDQIGTIRGKCSGVPEDGATEQKSLPSVVNPFRS